MQLKKVITLLEDARNAATMRDAGFGFPNEHVVKCGATGIAHSSPEHIMKFIVDRTALYRETWIIPQLDDALAELRAELDKRRKNR